jgi:glycine C-acetyltransferase
MYGNLKQHLQNELHDIKEAGLYKHERIISSPQGAEITLNTGKTVLKFCANKYLGLSSHPDVIEAAKDTMGTPGF